MYAEDTNGNIEREIIKYPTPIKQKLLESKDKHSTIVKYAVRKQGTPEYTMGFDGPPGEAECVHPEGEWYKGQEYINNVINTAMTCALKGFPFQELAAAGVNISLIKPRIAVHKRGEKMGDEHMIMTNGDPQHLPDPYHDKDTWYHIFYVTFELDISTSTTKTIWPYVSWYYKYQDILKQGKLIDDLRMLTSMLQEVQTATTLEFPEHKRHPSWPIQLSTDSRHLMEITSPTTSHSIATCPEDLAKHNLAARRQAYKSYFGHVLGKLDNPISARKRRKIIKESIV